MENKRINNKIYFIFNLIFFFSFIIIYLIIIFNNNNVIFSFSLASLIICAAAGPLGAYFAFRLFRHIKPLKANIEYKLLAILLVLYYILQLYLGLNLSVGATWDMGIVYQSAADYVNNGIFTGWYYERFPNNNALYILWCAYFSVLHFFGINEYMPFAIALSALAINISILLMFLSVRRILGRRKAWFCLLFAFCTIPFAIYAPIIYSDTISMVFPIGTAYMWIITREHINKGDIKASVWRIALMSVFVAIGSLFKISVAIMWIAIIIDLLALVKAKGKYIVLGAGCGAFALTYFFGTLFIRHPWCLPELDYSKSMPFTHWIMMGLRGYGGYSEEDYEMTVSIGEKSARAAMNMVEIKRRLGEMGTAGLYRHIMNKLGFTWGDATYYSVAKLSIDPVKNSFAGKFFRYGQPYLPLFAYSQLPLHMAVIGGMAGSAAKSIVKGNNRLTFARIAVFGLMLFLLIWETRSRYLFNFLPVFILCAADALPENLPSFPFSKRKKEKL